jgi:hypothetical protein
VTLGVKNSFWRNPKVIYSGAIKKTFTKYAREEKIKWLDCAGYKKLLVLLQGEEVHLHKDGERVSEMR